MPRPRDVLNAFTVSELSRITDLSIPMANYLSDKGFLRPAFGNPYGRRGKVRYYSYRDLVIARLVQHLREGGVALHSLKEAIQQLSTEPDWMGSVGDPADQLRWLVTDGKEVLFKNRDGFLDTLTGSGQRAFSFIVDLHGLEQEVRERVPERKREQFQMGPYEIQFAEVRKTHVKKG